MEVENVYDLYNLYDRLGISWEFQCNGYSRLC